MADPKKIEQMATDTTETALKLETVLTKEDKSGVDSKEVGTSTDTGDSNANVSTSNAAKPEVLQQPQTLSNGLYLLVFDKSWGGYNAKEQAAFEKAKAEQLVVSKIARYVPEKTA